MSTPNQRKRKAQRLADRVDEAITILDKFDTDRIADLYRRREQSHDVDGFPAGGGGESTSGTGDHDPTLAAAMARMAQTTRDPIGESLSEAFTTLHEVLAGIRRLDKLITVVLNVSAKAKERVTSLSQCTCCGRDVTGIGEDRIVSGYCPTCKQAWYREGRPDRLTFEKRRREQLDAECGDTST